MKKIIKNKVVSFWKDEVWEGVNKDDIGCVFEDWEFFEFVDLIFIVIIKILVWKVYKKVKCCFVIFFIFDKLW